MKYYILTSVCILNFAPSYSQVTSENLSGRSILIFSPAVSNEQYNEQIRLLSIDPLELDQRNISILEIFPAGGIESDGSEMGEIRVNKFRMDYKISINEFRLILLDADSSVILNATDVTDLYRLINLIDSKKQN
jgi:hypothetical protein